MHLLWDIRVSLDLFLGGLGVGAFLVGAVLFFIDARLYESIIKKAFIIAPIMVMTGLLMLLSELGRPMNVIKTIYAVNPTSFMSIGIFVQSVFVAVALLVAFSTLSKKIKDINKVLVYITVSLAGLVGLYHGFLLTGISIEPWNNALPVMFLTSSVIAGSSLVFLLSVDKMDELFTNLKLPVVINLVLTLQFAAVFIWVYNLALTSASSRHIYEVLMSGFGMEFWVLSVLVGIVIPAGLLTFVLLKQVSFKVVALPVFVMMIAGSFFFKNLVVYLGQAI
ncbi:MAG: polysulfide reductase NrfD [Sulfurospirillum sp.]|nr:polysulfide reductase NrfD [Sulfurospirillum sp.]